MKAKRVLAVTMAAMMIMSLTACEFREFGRKRKNED